MFVSTLFCGSNMLNRAFITKTTSGELGFRNRKSTRDDLLLTDVGVRFPDRTSDHGRLFSHTKKNVTEEECRGLETKKLGLAFCLATATQRSNTGHGQESQ